LSVGAGSPNRTASVPPRAGSTFTWTIGNGTITAGQGTNQITFTAGTAGTPVTLGVTESNPSACTGSPGNASVPVNPAGSSILFYTVAPCRQLDTRSGSPMAGGGSLTVALTGGACGIPAVARSVSVNVTATESTAAGFLAFQPGDDVTPASTSTLNFGSGQTRANNSLLILAGDGSGSVKITNGAPGTVHVIVDVNGYFQ